MAGVISVFILLSASIISFALLYSNRARRHQKALQLKEKQKQLELLNATINAQERERERIGADIHDDIGPMLSTTKLLINKFKYLDKKEDVTQHIKRLEAQLDEAIERVREVAKNLVPQVLVEFGLVEAISDLCSRINEGGDVKAKMEVDPAIPIFDRTQELALYRIIQEFCTNTLKYAKASQIFIQFKVSGNGFVLELSDDGIGIAQEHLQEKGGLGLNNMHARAKSIGADMQLETKRSIGTRILLTLSNET